MLISSPRDLRQKAYEIGQEEVIAAVEQRIKETEKNLGEHIKDVRKTYPLFTATKYPEPIELVDASLKENEYVLAYDVTDSALLIYLARGKELVKGLLKPVTRKELEGLVRNFREPMEIKPGESVNEKLKAFDFSSGKKLSDYLLSGVIEDVPVGTPLIIVPDESLGVVPFEMLVLKDGGKVVSDKGIPRVVDTEFFGDRHPISYYQSVNALTLARNFRRPTESAKNILVVADPVFETTDARAAKTAASQRSGRLSGPFLWRRSHWAPGLHDGRF